MAGLLLSNYSLLIGSDVIVIRYDSVITEEIAKAFIGFRPKKVRYTIKMSLEDLREITEDGVDVFSLEGLQTKVKVVRVIDGDTLDVAFHRRGVSSARRVSSIYLPNAWI